MPQLNRFLALLKIGPTQPLTLFIYCITFVESFVALKLSDIEPTSPLTFAAVGTTAILLWWLVVVWLLWFSVRWALRRTHSKRATLTVWTTTGIFVWSFLCVYLAAWGIRFYTGVFPNYDSLRMMGADAGIGFIFSFVGETAPAMVGWSVIGAVSSLLIMPVLVRWSIQKTWPSPNNQILRVAYLTGLSTAAVGLFCIAMINYNIDYLNRRAQLRYLGSALSPPVSMITSSVQAIIFSEPIPANMSMQSRVAITSGPDYKTVALASPPPNILYIAVESLRADLVHLEVDGVEVMPNLNEFAKSGFYFTNGFAQASHTDYCIPSYLSSLYPLRTPEHYYYEKVTPWPKKLITDYLENIGYSAGIISSDNTNWGKMRNFMWSANLDVFFDSENMPTTYSLTDTNRGYVTSQETLRENGSRTAVDKHMVDVAMVWMQRQIGAGKPFILHTMFQDTHYPYQVRADYPRPFNPSDNTTFKHTLFKCPPEMVHVQRNAYYNAAHAVDIELGRIIEFLKAHGQWDNTIIVLVGDHGEAFNENGLMAHAGPNIQPVIRVPLIISSPGVEGRTIDYPAQQVDMAPTLCGLLGIDPHPTYQGINLLVDDLPPLEDRYLYVSSAVPGLWRGDNIVHAGRWNFWADYTFQREELYDLQNDPTESHNLVAEKPEIANALRRRLKQWRQDQLAYYKYPMFYGKYYPPKVVTKSGARH